jgi:uncharacterized protein
MKKLLDYIIPNIVDHPEAVIITESKTPSGIIISIEVSPEDMGRVIGKEGKVIKAIRQIARVMAIRQDEKIQIDVVDKNPEHKQETSAEISEEGSETPEVEVKDDFSSEEQI